MTSCCQYERYRSLNKPVHQVVAQPIRLVLVEGEPYLWAWDREGQKLKNYKVARIEQVASRPALTTQRCAGRSAGRSRWCRRCWSSWAASGAGTG